MDLVVKATQSMVLGIMMHIGINNKDPINETSMWTFLTTIISWAERKTVIINKAVLILLIHLYFQKQLFI